MNQQNPQRTFLKRMAALAAAPFILPSRVWSAPTGPNDQVTLGAIGVGVMGNGLLGHFLPFPEARGVPVCDVDPSHRDAAKKRVDDRYKDSDCAADSDFREIISRKEIDAVVIAPPDHWHANRLGRFDCGAGAPSCPAACQELPPQEPR